MELNLTGVDLDLYYSINSSIQVGLFFLIALPALILILLCVVALLFAKSINWPIRIVLIDIYAAEICYWLGTTVILLGFPVRARLNNKEHLSCSVAFALFFSNSPLKFSATALYSITVYIFVKYGIQKVKLYAIILYISISWIASIGFSIFLFFAEFEVLNNYGFCDANSNSNNVVGVIIFIVQALILICIIIVFSLLTYCYVKKNTLQDNVEVKKAIVKNLFYLTVYVIISVITIFGPVFFHYSKEATDMKRLIYILLVDYLVQVAVYLPYMSIPIAAIIILKPIRDALKQGIRKTMQLMYGKLSVTIDESNRTLSYPDELRE